MPASETSPSNAMFDERTIMAWGGGSWTAEFSSLRVHADNDGTGWRGQKKSECQRKERRVCSPLSLIHTLFLIMAFVLLTQTAAQTSYITQSIPPPLQYGGYYAVALYLVVNVRSLRPCMTTWSILLLFVVTLVSTSINGGGTLTYLRQILPPTCMLLLIEVLQGRRQLPAALELFSDVGVLLIVADLLSILAFPDGMYSTALYSDNWLLGYKTNRARFGLPALAFSALSSYRRRGTLGVRTHVGFIALIASSVLTESGMGTAACILNYALLLAHGALRGSEGGLSFLFDYRVWVVFIAGASLCVYVLGTNDAMASFLVSIGKDPTFTGRTLIWGTTIDRFLESPFLGFGYVNGDAYQLMTGVAGGTQAHSLLLTVLGLGGLQAVVLLALAVWSAFRGYRPRASLSSGSIMGALMAAEALMGFTSCTFYAALTLPSLVVLFYADRAECGVEKNG